MRTQEFAHLSCWLMLRPLVQGAHCENPRSGDSAGSFSHLPFLPCISGAFVEVPLSALGTLAKPLGFGFVPLVLQLKR